MRLNPVRIVIADDHELVRNGIAATLRRQPGFEVVGEAHDGAPALELCERLKPDVLVLDILMPEVTGLQVLRRLPARSPDTLAVMLSMEDSELIVREALESGAKGYVLKSDAARDLATAVRSVTEGRPFFTARVAAAMLAVYLSQRSSDKAEPSGLTARERDVVRGIARGLGNKQLAPQLGISVRTVETHRSNIMEMLGVHSVADLVLYAVRAGLADAAEPSRPTVHPWVSHRVSNGSRPRAAA